jgi:glycosyltransferase involved in cell wall biosynthesis
MGNNPISALTKTVMASLEHHDRVTVVFNSAIACQVAKQLRDLVSELVVQNEQSNLRCIGIIHEHIDDARYPWMRKLPSVALDSMDAIVFASRTSLQSFEAHYRDCETPKHVVPNWISHRDFYALDAAAENARRHIVGGQTCCQCGGNVAANDADRGVTGGDTEREEEVSYADRLDNQFQVEKKTNRASSSFTVFAFGEVEPYNDQLVIAHAVAQINKDDICRSARLVMVGPVTNRLYASQVVKAGGGPAAVQFIHDDENKAHAPTASDVREAIARSDVFVHAAPHVSATMAGCVLEPMYMETPVVAANTPGVREQIQNEKRGSLV